MPAFVMLGLVFSRQSQEMAWGTSTKWPILCGVRPKTTAQSITNLQLSTAVLCSAHVVLGL